MGLFGENKTVEQIFGVGEDDIKARLEAGTKAQEELTKLKEAQAQRDREFQEMQERLKRIEQGTTSKTTTENDERENRPVSVVENEDEAFNQRLTPLYLDQLSTRAEIIYDRVARKFKDWDKFKTEIDELLKNTPLQAKVHEATIENAYHIARGKKVDDIVKDTIAGQGSYFMESGRNAGNGGTTEKKTPDELLSPEEKAMAAKHGMTNEQWLKSKEGIKYV